MAAWGNYRPRLPDWQTKAMKLDPGLAGSVTWQDAPVLLLPRLQPARRVAGLSMGKDVPIAPDNQISVCVR
jgi:hypothetical protein